MPKDVFALSVRPPWSWAIVRGGKSVENRDWYTAYRGRLIIHASKELERSDVQWLHLQGIDAPAAYDRGALIGEVTLVDCVRISDAVRDRHRPWAFGPWCWVLENPIAYPEPIPYRGQLGLFLVSEEVLSGRAAAAVGSQGAMSAQSMF